MSQQYDTKILAEIKADIGLDGFVTVDYFWTKAPYIDKKFPEAENKEIFNNAYNLYALDYARGRPKDFQEIFRQEAIKRRPRYQTYYYQQLMDYDNLNRVTERAVLSIQNIP